MLGVYLRDIKVPNNNVGNKKRHVSSLLQLHLILILFIDLQLKALQAMMKL